MGKFARSWDLFKCSFQVLLGNRRLFLFPIIVSILTCLIICLFLVPLAFWNTGHGFTEAAHWKILGSNLATWTETPGKSHVIPNTMGYLVLAGFYFVITFLATFLNVAFFNEILHALNGQPVSVRGGLRFAMTRLKGILLWSLLTDTVGLIIGILEERVGWVAGWVLRFVGMTWSVASIFVVPIIVREEEHANPVVFLKTSASILKRTWGESLIGYVGIEFGNWIIVMGSIAIIVPAMLILSVLFHTFVIAAIIGVVWVLVVAAFVLVMSVGSQVYRAALYIYATEGVVPGPFDQSQMDMAWKVKAGRKAV